MINQNKRRSICLIHSDQDINDLFKTFLEYSGYQVDGFTKPSDGLSSFKKKNQDLVLCGLVFSEMDGLTLYKRLKRIDNKVRILIVTANIGSAESLKDRYPETADNLIYEPISLNELKNKVDSIILNGKSG